MDQRRGSRSVIDPKVRHVGFFTPPESTTNPLPFPNSLSPVMIPPPTNHPPLQRDSNPSSASSPGGRKFASSLPTHFSPQLKQKNLTTVTNLQPLTRIKFSDKLGNQSSESQDAESKPLKEKTSKAERRLLQEPQRAAKGWIKIFGW